MSTEVDGSWFLWVVGTQSLATAAAALDEHANNAALADAAVGLWGIGVMLYVMLATLVTLRLLTTRRDPHKLGPSYWIYMGATAITVLAGSRILAMSPDLPVIHVTVAFVSGFTYVLWAFGMWWIPLLVIFGIWRHAVRHEPVRYESGALEHCLPARNVLGREHPLRRSGRTADTGRHRPDRHLDRRIRLAHRDSRDGGIRAHQTDRHPIPVR